MIDVIDILSCRQHRYSEGAKLEFRPPVFTDSLSLAERRGFLYSKPTQFAEVYDCVINEGIHCSSAGLIYQYLDVYDFPTFDEHFNAGLARETLFSHHYEWAASIDFKKQTPGQFLSVANRYYKNYFHWHTEALLSLFQAFKYEPIHCWNVVLPILAQYQKDSLSLLGLSSSGWEVEGVSSPMELIYLPLNSWTIPGHGSGDAYAFNFLDYREMICTIKQNVRLRNFGNNTSHRSRPKYVYLSRLGNTRRMCSNELELINRLTEIGFAVYNPEHLSYCEQIELMMDASVVVSFAGALVTNAAFLSDKGLYIVIEPVEHREIHDWPRYFSKCGTDYAIIYSGRGVNFEERSDGRLKYANSWRITGLDRLASRIARLLAWQLGGVAGLPAYEEMR